MDIPHRNQSQKLVLLHTQTQLGSAKRFGTRPRALLTLSFLYMASCPPLSTNHLFFHAFLLSPFFIRYPLFVATLSSSLAPSLCLSDSIARATPGPSERADGIRPTGERACACPAAEDESESEPDWPMSDVSEMAERWSAPEGGGRSELRVWGEVECSASLSEGPVEDENELFCACQAHVSDCKGENRAGHSRGVDGLGPVSGRGGEALTYAVGERDRARFRD